MRLTELGLDGFRNLEAARLDLHPEGAVLVGANGQGKTNVLEAIHYLALFRSFRGTRHADAIGFGGSAFRIEGRVAHADGRTRRVVVAVDRSSRRISIDGHEVGRIGDAVGTIVTVVVSPDDLDLVVGAPETRRRYLDALLSQTSRRYWNALQSYDRALGQRNELLRGPGRPSGPLLATWDDAVVDAGVPIVAARAELVGRLAHDYAELAATIAGAGESAAGFGIRYRPSVPLDGEAASDPAAIAEAWKAALAERLERDVRRGWTGVGPHRDEVRVELGGRRLDRFGSQGEKRTGAIALRLLEARVLEEEIGQLPILLLDDVFSELDQGRAERLLEALGEGHQRFVTTPRPLSWFEGSLPRWRIAAGRIEPARIAA